LRDDFAEFVVGCVEVGTSFADKEVLDVGGVEIEIFVLKEGEPIVGSEMVVSNVEGVVVSGKTEFGLVGFSRQVPSVEELFYLGFVVFDCFANLTNPARSRFVIGLEIDSNEGFGINGSIKTFESICEIFWSMRLKPKWANSDIE
jgi:hypothetical protein